MFFLQAPVCRRESLCLWLNPQSKVFILARSRVCVQREGGSMAYGEAEQRGGDVSAHARWPMLCFQGEWEGEEKKKKWPLTANWLTVVNLSPPGRQWRGITAALSVCSITGFDQQTARRKRLAKQKSYHRIEQLRRTVIWSEQKTKEVIIYLTLSTPSHTHQHTAVIKTSISIVLGLQWRILASLVLSLNNAWLISQLRNRVKLSTGWKLKRDTAGSRQTRSLSITHSWELATCSDMQAVCLLF